MNTPVKRIILPAFLAGVLSATAVPGFLWAQEENVESDAWLDDVIYYEIGGGQPFAGPAGYGRHARIRGDGSLALGYSCGNFDLTQNIRGMFGRLSQGLDKSVSVLTYGLTGAVASLPLYLLRQANPNLANMLENMMLRYEEQYNLAVKSCRDAELQILAGENPYYDWVSWGQQDSWRKSAGSGVPVDEIEESVGDKHGCITWIGGEQYFCDDSDNREITVVEDVAKAGYDVLAEADDDAGGAPPGAPPSRMKTHWPTSEDAAEEILQMTGETVITNARTTPPAGQPPRGTAAGMHEDAVNTSRALSDAIDQVLSGNRPDQADLQKLSVPGLAITPTLLWTLGNLSPSYRTAAIDRIATEIALLRMMEKITLARRVLLAGSRLPEVEASPARERIREDAIVLLEMEHQLLKDEYELRSRAGSSTAAKLMRNTRDRQLSPVPGGGGTPAAPPEDGAVIR